jgi:hypothetical protein
MRARGIDMKTQAPQMWTAIESYTQKTRTTTIEFKSIAKAV